MPHRSTLLFRTACALLALGCASAAAATSLSATADAQVPQPYTAEYEVLRNGKAIGRGEVSFHRVDAATWELLSTTRGTGGLAGMAGLEIVERSSVQWFEGRPESFDYHHRQQAAWRSRERRVRFEPDTGRIISQDRRGEHVFAFERGVLDRQSVMLALAQDLAAGRRGTLSYTVVDRDEFGPQQYRVDAEDAVDVPIGRVTTIAVTRVRSPGSGRATTIWLQREAPFVPVRTLQQEGDGDTIELRLAALRVGPAPASPR